MTSRAAVDDFLAQPGLALVGASRTGRKFGNTALRELLANGWRVFPVHPSAGHIDGVPCAASLASLPESVGGVVLVTPPSQTERLVEEAAEAGIKRVWMQQGAESPAAIQFCEEHGMQVIAGECILMFARPRRWYHLAHRWLWRVLGKLPA
jgi:predicted CoA-binding protein